MKFRCPHCDQPLEADPSWAGQSLNCPGCSIAFTVPPPSLQAKRPFPRATFLTVMGVLLLAGFAFHHFSARNRIAADVERIEWFPPHVHLKGSQDHQSYTIQALMRDGSTRDITRLARVTLEKPELAQLQETSLRPARDGQSRIIARYAGKETSTDLTVTRAGVERPVGFRMDVMPILMKAGCNSGNCHGASRGKEGFHLSLFGYDPEGDHRSLTREQIGRRINLAQPEESLLLQKAVAGVAHGGGERFKIDSESYRTLLRWIAEGARDEGTQAPAVVSLELFPSSAVLVGSGATQRLTARARYSDGTDRDVTALAVFFSNNEVTTKVADDGLMTSGQRGEAFVMARFATHTVGCQVMVVPENSAPIVEPPETHYIDQSIQTKLRKLRMSPSPVCDDSTFIRRAYLDINGILPTPEQTRDFVQDPTPDKRGRLVDTLLNQPEFAELWVMKFADLLQIRSNQDQFSYKATLQYYDWLKTQLLQKVPVDRIVQQLLTGTGSTFQNPVANYYQVQTDTLKIAENTAQVFMGMRIQCAQCHNHPFDRWTMNDYYGFAAFFAQIGRKPGEDPRETIVFDRTEGDMKNPVGQKVMAPRFLGGEQPVIPAGTSRRETLARWMASDQNPYFARNMANIIWAHFMGRGIIDPVDDVRVSNPASNPELLDALSSRFTHYGYDFRKLVRDICTSKAYQRSTQGNESNESDDRNFARAQIRRLRAEVLLDVITQVTETRNKFQGLPRGSRAVEIPDGNVNNYFLRTFGRATRATVCSCEVRTEPNLSQALHLLNGTTVQEKLDQSTVITQQLKDGKKPQEIIEDLYLRCFGRTPTARESETLKEFYKDAKNPAPVLQDVFWGLLNSKEFIFNH